MNDNFEEVYSEQQFKIKLFTPNATSLFGGKWKRLNVKSRIRFYIYLIYGYKVYHLFENNEEVAYLVVSRGGQKRYPFAAKEDIIIGPVFVSEEKRGKRLFRYLANNVLCILEEDYINAYAFINKSNKPSIKSFMACGFTFDYEAKYSKYLRVLLPIDDGSGNFLIYKYTNNKKFEGKV